MDRVMEWGRVWLAGVCLGLVIVAWTWWPVRNEVLNDGLMPWLQPRLILVAAAAAVVALVIVGAHAWWQSRRTARGRVLARISQAVVAAAGEGRGHTVSVRWRGRTPARISVTAPKGGASSSTPGEEIEGEGSGLPARLARSVGQALGEQRWRVERARRRLIILTPAGAETADEHERDEVADRASRLIRQTIPKTKSVAVKRWDEAGNPTQILARYEPTPKISSPAFEAACLVVIGNSFPGRWRGSWDREHDSVTFETRPGLPELALRPAGLQAAAGKHIALRYGVDEDGGHQAWALTGPGSSPHALIVGPTGGGKTVTLRAMILDAISQGVVVHGADPKRIELMGLRGVPGVQEITTQPADMVAQIEAMHALMMLRYDQIETRQVKAEDLVPHLFVLDEFFIMVMLLNSHWVREDGKGRQHPVLGQVWEMLALARSARVHLLIGIQRPDAEFIPGAARDNLGHRVSLTALSDTGAQMVWQDSTIGRDLPNRPGRATASRADGGAHEIQVWFLPDPDPHTRAERAEHERALLDEIFAGAAPAGSDPQLPRYEQQEAGSETGQGGLDAARAALPEASSSSREGHTADPTDGGESAAPTADTEAAPEPATVTVSAESVVAGDQVQIEGTLVELTAVDVDPVDEDYVLLEWAQGSLSVPGSEQLARL